MTEKIEYPKNKKMAALELECNQEYAKIMDTITAMKATKAILTESQLAMSQHYDTFLDHCEKAGELLNKMRELAKQPIHEWDLPDTEN